MSFIEENRIFGGASRVVLAVSGGADSMAMAHLICGRYPQYRYIIAHVNHGLRPEAAEEEALVRETARRLEAEYRCFHFDAASLAKERGKGIEEIGREERYRFFRSLGADLILTAHHKDDHAETVLMHLMRGSGLKGLCGLEPRSADIGRPLLCVSKEEIYAYCAEKKIPYREDPSNEDTVYTRNKVRRELMPLMKEINPGITEAIYRLSLALAADEACLSEIAASSYGEHSRVRGDERILELTTAFFREPALARRWIRAAAKERGVELSFERTEAIRRLGVGKALPLTTGSWVSRTYDRLIFGPRKTEERRTFNPIAVAEGETVSDDGSLTVTARRHRPAAKGCVDSRGFFPEALFAEAPPVLRRRRDGDYILLDGGRRKKLSDYFIDEKIPREEREEQLLLAVGPRVLWLVGKRFFALPDEDNLEIRIDKNFDK